MLIPMLLALATTGAGAGQSPTGTAVVGKTALSSSRSVLDRYCVTCHNQTRLTGGLALDTLDLTDVAGSSEVLERVVHKLRSAAMPPPGRPRPSPEATDALVSSLEAALDAWAVAHPNPGRPAAHRLNRTEYKNAIRDLLGLEIDTTALLPADDMGFGFDNIADTLSFSPLLLERYMSASRKISRRAVGDQ